MPVSVSLDDILVKFSRHDGSNDDENSTDSFWTVLQEQLKGLVDTYDENMHEKVKELLSKDDKDTKYVNDDANEANEDHESIRDDNKLELITVLSIIKTVQMINTFLGDLPLTTDISRKINILLLSLVSMFKYHFQLPVTHNNYAFKNFGKLLTSESTNIVTPFIKFMNESMSTNMEHNKSETLEKSFTLLLVLHSYNKDLFAFLFDSLNNSNMANDIFYSFDLKSKTSMAPLSASSSAFSSSFTSLSNTLCTDIPSISSVMYRFKMLILLEESTLVSDTKSTNLINILFFSSYHKLLLIDLISNFIKLNELFKNGITFNNLFDYTTNIISNSKSIDYLSIYLCHNVEAFDKLDDFAKSENPSHSNIRDVSMFLLLKVSSNILMNYNIFATPKNQLLSFINEYNNQNYLSILGISESNNVPELNLAMLIPIFEFYDQNFKLDYFKERDFLATLKLALINLDLNMDSDDDFMNLNSLLIDIGCSISLHALVDKIQTLLVIIINKIKFKSEIDVFNKIPSDYEDNLGFNSIPPVYRSDMSFENNIVLQSDSFGEFYNILMEIENHSSIISSDSVNLLESSLVLLLSIKSKVYKFMKNLNIETNVLRLPDIFTTNVESNNSEEYSLNSFKQGIATKISSFKSAKSLNYKLLNASIILNINSNLSLLILSENYKYLKSNSLYIDNSLSRLLSEFTFDFSLTFLVIYQEFGLLNFFKSIRTMNYQNLKMILPTSILIFKLFQTKTVDSPTLSSSSSSSPIATPSNNKSSTQSQAMQTTQGFAIHSSNLDLITEILCKSVIASNLLRQYVELFDDGQSKPFKILHKFLKSHPSTLKPSKISKGTAVLDVDYYTEALLL